MEKCLTIKLGGNEIILNEKEIWDIKYQVQSWIEGNYFEEWFEQNNKELYAKYKDEAWFRKEVSNIGESMWDDILDRSWVWEDIGEVENELCYEFETEILNKIEELEEGIN